MAHGLDEVDLGRQDELAVACRSAPLDFLRANADEHVPLGPANQAALVDGNRDSETLDCRRPLRVRGQTALDDVHLRRTDERRNEESGRVLVESVWCVD